ncbi:hypothetical protein [Pseudocolwellia sp. HL-MZ7]|uniref:hypothetical protein n=1 Tax=Pseudocolwellia sp. HL-MZ7 TaxID=3400627 RepID=UPI003CF977A1
MNKILLVLLILIQTGLLLFSQQSVASPEESDFLGENSRWTIDASTRITHNIDKEHSTFMHAIGLDIHKVFSNDTSDIGTLLFQPYIVRINNNNNPSLTFDDGNDTEITWRMVNFNYTGLSQGQFNIRVGHFEVPFGLEYQLDTNGTLRQFTISDRGIKGDWGVSVNGILPLFEYEIAITRGSGNEIRSHGNPHIFSGRIGTLSNKNMVAGLSWFTGDVLGRNGVTQRQKLGIDASYYYYQWQFKAESSVGSTAKNDTVNALIEALWMNPRESLSSYIQLGYQSTEINHEISNATQSTSYWLAGVQWLDQNGFDISAQYKHKLEDTATIEIDPVLSVQLRYRM